MKAMGILFGFISVEFEYEPCKMCKQSIVPCRLSAIKDGINPKEYTCVITRSSAKWCEIKR